MTGPRQGEFWIVEAGGKVSVAKCVVAAADGTQWVLPGSADRKHSSDADFRAVRRLDLAALIDRDDVQKDRLIWLLIEAVGGKVKISRRALEDFDERRSTVDRHDEPGGTIVFRSFRC